MLIWYFISSSMSSKKSNKQLNSKVGDSIGARKTTPITAKIVLFVFGLGPLIIMGLFLFLNGFFN